MKRGQAACDESSLRRCPASALQAVWPRTFMPAFRWPPPRDSTERCQHLGLYVSGDFSPLPTHPRSVCHRDVRHPGCQALAAHPHGGDGLSDIFQWPLNLLVTSIFLNPKFPLWWPNQLYEAFSDSWLPSDGHRLWLGRRGGAMELLVQSPRTNSSCFCSSHPYRCGMSPMCTQLCERCPC